MNYLYPAISRSVPLFLSQLKLNASHVRPRSLLTSVKNYDQPIRTISLSQIWNQENETQETEVEEEINPIILRHPERDRRKVISVETSIRYLQSAAFKEAYGDKPVWFYYRRNHKGLWPPAKTRRLCVVRVISQIVHYGNTRGDVVATGNPCPICRDEYLIVHYTNLELLKQFISPFTGNIIEYQKTGVCQKQHKNLLVALEIAKDLGLITFDVPYRSYNYSEFKLE